MKPGDFVWYELMTSDAKAAVDFYAGVIGWAVEAVEMPGMTYYLAKVGDRQVAGLMGFPPGVEGIPPNWTGYVAVEDVDAMAERVTAAGGNVHRAPDDIPGVGRFAVVADRQGAVFQLFKGAGEPAPDLPYMTPGTIGWHELHTSDREDAFTFYAGLFGWQKGEALDMGPMGIYQLITTGGEMPVGAMFSDDRGPQSYWLYYFAVDDIDAATARATGKGASVVMGPMEVPGGAWVVIATDPQGAFFALVGMRTV